MSVLSPPHAEATRPRPAALPLLTWELLVALTVLGGIGVAGLVRGPGLWYDDAYSLAMADQSWGDLLVDVRMQEVNNAGYYGFLHLWALVSHDLWWLRLPGVLAALATTVLLARVAGRAGDRWTLRVSLLVMVGLYGTWDGMLGMRGYPFSMLLGALAVVLLLDLTDRPDTSRARSVARALVLIGVAALATIVNLLLLLLVLALLVVAAARRSRPATVALAVAVLPGAAMWLLAVSADRGQVDWIPSLGPMSIAIQLGLLVGSLVGLVALVLAGVLALGTAAVSMGSATLERRRLLAMAFAWGAGGVVGILVLSLVKPLLQGRYLLFCVPGIALLLGVAAGAALADRRRLVRTAGVTVVVLVLVAVAGNVERSLGSPPWGEREDLSAAAALIRDEQRPGDALDYLTPIARTPFDQMLRAAFGGPSPLVDVTRNPSAARWDVGGERSAEIDPAAYAPALAAAPGRLWVVSRQTVTGELPTSGPVVEARDADLARRTLLLDRQFGWMHVQLYSARRG
ncbi:hypothetical protein K8Z61_10420 [Nocardioides sp. TRM66260-LWL]|uniref:hypothetical protein n=1 Tax=Nocardioides sp. TRM66260-LWL TaxID=2874478 RepID=UPI001CC57D8A|nr:hypothetical protein [Nocardioides sp. TRM66260-LWL]MBZ5734910.1 hypothetical protein [Nocardioides sp. TRM66260-LWL]